MFVGYMPFTFGIGLGVLAMVGFGVMNALSREPARRLGNDETLFWRGVLMTVLQAVVLALFWSSDISWPGVALALGIGIFGYLPIYFFYRALAREPVGVVSPIANSASVITILLGVFLLGEPFSGIRAVGVAVVFSGILLLSGNPRSFASVIHKHKTSGIPYALAACLLWGVVFFLFRYPVLLIGPVLTSFIVEACIMVIAGTRMRATREPFRFPRGLLRTFLALALFGVIGALAYNRGLETEAVSLVAAFYMANPLVATATAAIIYRERLSLSRYAGLALAVVGVILVAVG